MSAAPVGTGDPEARLRLLFWIFVAGYFAVGLLTLTNEHRWGDDWAQYVLHARNLVTGHPYPDTGYLFNPDAANVGPASYPPGLPLLLAPFVAIFGINLVALKVVGLACIALTLPVALRLMAPVTGTRVAMVALVLLALHPVFWQQRQFIHSDAPYMLFNLLALWWCVRPPVAPASRHGALIAGLVLGVLLYASVICRAIGIVLLPALVAYGWAQRKPFGWFAGLGFSFLLLLWLQSIWLVAPPTYASELTVPTVRVVAGKPGGYLGAFADLLPLPFGLGPLAAALMTLASVAGAWFACTRPRPDSPGAGNLRAMAARVPLVVWYLAAYVAALFAASVGPDSRLLLPILPIVFILAAYGTHEIAMRFVRGRALLLPAAALCLAYLSALHASGRYTPAEQMATCKECLEMFSYVRAHTAPETVIVFTKPRALALFADRPAWAPSFRSLPDNLARQMARMRAHIVVDGVPGSEFARRYPASTALQARIRDPDAEVLFRNSSFLVVRVGAPRQGS